MKLKVDENMPVEVAVVLLQAGHDAMTVYDQQLVGSSDDRLLVACHAEGRAVVTLDLDFANIIQYPPANYSGLIVLRLESQELTHVLSVVQSMLVPALAKESPSGQLWVIDEERLRIRP